MTSFSGNAIVQGQKSAWSLVKKLGEGDAGEVFLVESQSDHHLAILKRPQRSVFAGDVRRQSEQISIEGRILKALETVLADLPQDKIHAPGLLDRSKPGSESSDRFFIIIERAVGFDLSSLARISRLGLPDNNEIEATPAESVFLQEIAHAGKIPERILLEALSSIFTLFAAIHEISTETSAVEVVSILWNDVKPDHLFWNPHNASFTIIDWGNGQINDSNTPERGLRHVPADDRRQFLEEMSRFLMQVDSDLVTRLDWPEKIPAPEELVPLYSSLRERVSRFLSKETIPLKSIRQEEGDLVQIGPQADLSIPRLDEIHKIILSKGEIPAYGAAINMATNLVKTLAAAGEMERVRQLCSWSAGLPGVQPQSWLLLANIAQSTEYLADIARYNILQAVQAAAKDDWEGVLWNMITALQSAAEPDWWYELVRQVRIQADSETANTIPPLLALRRLSLYLQSNCQQLEDKLAHSFSNEGELQLTAMNTLLDSIRNGIQNWVQLDPYPPYSGILYTEIEQLFPEIELWLPGRGIEMQHVTEPIRNQAAKILEAWERKEFITAGRELRYLLVLDPDRRRLLRSDQAVGAAPVWLGRIQQGPLVGEHLSDFVAGLEYEGRELRNQMGPAGWLDGILAGLKALRQGFWPGDLLTTQTGLLLEMPWLRKYIRFDVLTRLLRSNQPASPAPSMTGVRETRYGPENEISFIEPLDAWMPEARGSSARVYFGTYRTTSGEQREAAIKIMRLDKADYALPLFREEVKVLSAVDDVPGVARLIECGFMWMGGEESKLPSDDQIGAIQGMHGDIFRIGLDSLNRFFDLLEKRVKDGWTPYLLIEKRNNEDNLLLMCDASLNHGHFQPVPDLLFMSIQICDILHLAHQRQVVYRDHKILHYYWQPDNNGISLIDWNVARYHPEGLSLFDIQMDLVQLGARGLHHILTGRTAPGALPMGPTRPEEIERAAQSYAAQWTYDDQRLPAEVLTILEQLLSGSYSSAADLREDLKRAYMNLVSG